MNAAILKAGIDNPKAKSGTLPGWAKTRSWAKTTAGWTRTESRLRTASYIRIGSHSGSKTCVVSNCRKGFYSV